jgi:hypothetical protein
MPNGSAHRLLFQCRTDTAPGGAIRSIAWEQLASRDTGIEHLKLLIAKLRRMQFGRKSEKWERQIEQLEFPRCCERGNKIGAAATARASATGGAQDSAEAGSAPGLSW